MPTIKGKIVLELDSVAFDLTPANRLATVFNQSTRCDNLVNINYVGVITSDLESIGGCGNYDTLVTIATIDDEDHLPSNTVTATATLSFYESWGSYKKKGIYYMSLPCIIDTDGRVRIARRVSSAGESAAFDYWGNLEYYDGSVISVSATYMTGYAVDVDTSDIDNGDLGDFPVNMKAGSKPTPPKAGDAPAPAKAGDATTKDAPAPAPTPSAPIRKKVSAEVKAAHKARVTKRKTAAIKKFIKDLSGDSELVEMLKAALSGAPAPAPAPASAPAPSASS